MYSKEDVLSYWFASTEDIGPKTFSDVKQNYNLEELFNSPNMIKSVVKRKQGAQNLIARANLNLLKDEISRLHTMGIRMISCESKDYPADLKHVYLPPIVLFVKGKLDLGDLPFAIVGTRRATRNGTDNTIKISEELAEHGMCIVSGMAAGIDAAAHRGALRTGKTIAVLGCGVDQPYPAAHMDLYEEIIANGAVVSEFFPGTKAMPGNFPQRNRIITGMSKGVLVCEGEMKSGAHITANLALDQGKDVFALPGDISLPTSQLPNSLLEDGAKIAVGSRSILQYYGITEMKKNIEKCMLQLDFFQQQIYNQLLTGPLTLDELAELVDIPPAEIAGHVTLMEIQGAVKRLAGSSISIK